MFRLLIYHSIILIICSFAIKKSFCEIKNDIREMILGDSYFESRSNLLEKYNREIIVKELFLFINDHAEELTNTNNHNQRVYQLLKILAPNLNKKKQIEFLLTGLNDEFVGVRLHAASSLGRIKQEFSDIVIPRLIESLHDDDYRIVKNALMSLAHFGEEAKDAVPEIDPILIGDEKIRSKKLWDIEKDYSSKFKKQIGSVPEITTRFSAAFANIRIIGVEDSFKKFHNLNKNGKLSASMALSRSLIQPRDEKELKEFNTLAEEISDYLISYSLNFSTNSYDTNDLISLTLFSLLELQKRNTENQKLKNRLISALRSDFPAKDTMQLREYCANLIKQLEK